MSNAIEPAELPVRASGQGWSDLGLTPADAETALEYSAERTAMAYELADVLVCCPTMSNALKLDVSSGVLSKLQANEHGYPAGEFRGRFRRPDRERDAERWRNRSSQSSPKCDRPTAAPHGRRIGDCLPRMPIMAHLGEPARDLVSAPPPIVMRLANSAVERVPNLPGAVRPW